MQRCMVPIIISSNRNESMSCKGHKITVYCLFLPNFNFSIRHIIFVSAYFIVWNSFSLTFFIPSDQLNIQKFRYDPFLRSCLVCGVLFTDLYGSTIIYGEFWSGRFRYAPEGSVMIRKVPLRLCTVYYHSYLKIRP